MLLLIVIKLKSNHASSNPKKGQNWKSWCFNRKKRSFSKLVGRSFPRLSSAMRLAILKRRSTSVEVGGGVKNRLASLHMALMTLFVVSCSRLSQYLRQDTVSNGELKYFFSSVSSAFVCPSIILFLSLRWWKAAASPSWTKSGPWTSVPEFLQDRGPSWTWKRISQSILNSTKN